MKSQLTRKQIETGVGGLLLVVTLVALATTVRHQSTRAQAYKAASAHSSQTTILSTGGSEGTASINVDGQSVAPGVSTTSTTTNDGVTTMTATMPDGSTSTTTTTGGSQDSHQTSVNVTTNAGNGNSAPGSSQYTSVNSFTGSYGFQSSGSYHYTNGNVVIDQSH